MNDTMQLTVTGTYGLNVAHEHYRLEDIDPARDFLTHLPWPTGTLFAQESLPPISDWRRRSLSTPFSPEMVATLIFCSMHSVTPLVDLS